MKKNPKTERSGSVSGVPWQMAVEGDRGWWWGGVVKVVMVVGGLGCAFERTRGGWG